MARRIEQPTPIDELLQPPGAMEDPHGDSLFQDHPQQYLPTSKQERINRFRAEDLHERGIPSFRNASGDISAVTDETGAALSGFDSKNKVAYDSAGQPKLISYGPTGPPELKDPFADLPARTDPETGNIEKRGRGLYQWLGQDPAIEAQNIRRNKDKEIQKEASLLGRKLTLDEHDLTAGKHEHDAARKELQARVPTLLDPKYEGADLETVKKGIDEHFNAEYAAPEANNTAGWFSNELSPEAQATRADIDRRKAEAHAAAENLFAGKERLNQLTDSVTIARDQERAQVETLLAHQRGEEGPLDIAAREAATPKPAQLYPDESQWGRMLGGEKAAQLVKAGDVTELQQAARGDGAKPAFNLVSADKIETPYAEGERSYRVGDDKSFNLDPNNMIKGLRQATDDGVIDPEKAKEILPKLKPLQEAIDARNQLIKDAGGMSQLKALAHGAGIGAAFLAAAAPGAKGGAAIGAAVTAPAAEGGGLGPLIGGAIGGLITGTIGAFAARTGLNKLAESNDAIKSLTASAELHPVLDATGELVSFGAGGIRGVRNLYKLGQVASESVSDLGVSAQRIAAARAVGKVLGVGALSGAGFELTVRPAFDAARYAAADSLGIKHDQFQSPTVNSVLTNTALGMLLAGRNIQLKDYTAGDVASILFRARMRNEAGVPLDSTDSTAVSSAVNAFNQKMGGGLDSTQVAAASKPLTPQEAHLYNALKTKIDRMQQSGAFDDASGVTFASGTQAQVPTFGKNGEPISSAGVDVIKGPKTRQLGGEPPAPEKPVTGKDRTISPTTEKPAKGATDETSDRRQDVQKPPAGSEPATAGPPATKPPDKGSAAAQPVRADAGAATSEEAGKSALLKRNVVEPGDTLAEGDKKFTVVAHKDGNVVVVPADKPDATRMSFSTATLEKRLANNELIHTKAAPSDVDTAAHEAATSPKNDLPEPTEAQKEAGNYKKGHETINGLDISIENPAGSRRQPEFEPLQSHYGYIKGTVGADKDHIDIFIKQGTPKDYEGPVFVVNQHDAKGKFDEHKAVIGVKDAAEAKAEYLANYEKGWTGGKSVVQFDSVAEFKKWATSGATGEPVTQMSVSVVPPEGSTAHRPHTEGPHVIATAIKRGTKILTGSTWNEAHEGIGIRHGIEDVKPSERGFIVQTDDETQKFVSRKEAGPIAKAAGQTTAPLSAEGVQSAELKKATPKEHQAVVTQVRGTMGKHLEALKKLGHGREPAIGKTDTPSGIQAKEGKRSGEPVITIDPKKVLEATKTLTAREKAKFIQRAVEEEILHVAALKWERKDPENTKQIRAWGKEKDELAEHLSRSYAEWSDLSDWQKGHEKLRAVLQKRWTGKLTEAAYALLRDFLKYLRTVYEKLSAGQRAIVDEVEAMLKGETKAAPAETKTVKPDAKTIEKWKRDLQMNEQILASGKNLGKPDGRELTADERRLYGQNIEALRKSLADAGQPVAPVNAHGVFTGQAEQLEYRAGLSKKRPASLPTVEVRVIHTDKGWLSSGGWQFAKFGYGGPITITSTPHPTREAAITDALNFIEERLGKEQPRTDVSDKDRKEIAGALKWVSEQRAKLEETDATKTGKQPSGSQPKHQGVSPRADVRTDEKEVRQKDSGQASGSGSAVEQAPAPESEAEQPGIRQPEKASVLDPDTQKEVRAAFEGLFAGTPRNLTDKPTSTVSEGDLEQLRASNLERLGASPEKAIRLGGSKEVGDEASAAVVEKIRSESTGYTWRGQPSGITSRDRATGLMEWIQKQAKDRDMTVTELAANQPEVFYDLVKSFDRQWLGAGVPKLRRGEKQGDIFTAQTEDLTLAQESGIDWGERQRKAEIAEQERIAAQLKQDEAQGTLFAAAPQLALPAEKLAQFVALAQKLVTAGVDTPEKLATELKAIFGADVGKVRPYSQALWDAIGMVKPELRATHDWTKAYGDTPQDQGKPARKSRAPAPDGGFTEHPFIQAIMGDFGGIMSKSIAKQKLGERFAANASLWDGAPKLADPRHTKVYNPKSGQTPDAVAAGLADMGLLRDGDVEELWRTLLQISESSKRLERQERDQARTEKEMESSLHSQPAEDPFALDDEFLPSAPESRTIEGDDTGGLDDLEPDSELAAAPEPGGEDSVQAGPGTTRTPGTLLDDPTGGPENAATSGPLSADVPAAPHREPSDQLFPESAPAVPERPAGSPEPEGSSRPRDDGLSADTDRTKLPGEDLVVAPVSQGVGVGSEGSGAELDAIQRAAPALTPEQAEDVRFIEARLHEMKKPGVLLTNGTGTGKTFSGMGEVKMMLDRGAKHILIVVPSDKIGSDWVETAHRFFGVRDAAQLPSTFDNGSDRRMVVTTYANFGQNNTLVKRPWDLVVADESHYLSSSEGGDTTLALEALRALTWHPQGLHRRVQMLEPEAHDGLRTLRMYERRFKKLTQPQENQRVKFQAQLDATEKKVREELTAKTEAARPKVLFMSATPFAYRKSVDYGNGYLFDYPKVEDRGYNTPSPFGQFMIENFGYRMRTGKLTEPENATATGILERRFAERLMREKAMRGRALVVPHDYSRDFVLTESQLGAKVDEIISKMMSSARLRTLEKHIGVTDYLQRRFLLESLKAREAIPRIRKHLELGRKIVVFHDYKLGGAMNPLAPTVSGEIVTYTDETGERRQVSLGQAYAELKSHFPDWDSISAQLVGLKSPIAYFTDAFGAEELGVFNGGVSKRQRREIVKAFNDPNGKMRVMLAQRASAKEGISLHDIDGTHQRAFIDLGIPGRPTDAIQSEGRIYRHGVKSNAIDEYLVTGTNFERWTFAQTIAQRASTAENLAMGEGARALLMSFSTGFNEAQHFEPHEGQGVGGKQMDEVRERGDPYKNAVALYYTNEKKTSRSKSREGIDYFATPEPLGYKMIEWAALLPGEKFLEPSAGHGAIARFAPDSTNRHAVEPSNELAGRLALNAPDTEIHNQRFEDFNIVNKFDAIAMNPPFGTAGKIAMEHLAKAAKHLRDGGRLVALIPSGPSMDKRLEQWREDEANKEFYLVASIKLPSVTFERAGTGVVARIVVIDRSSNETNASAFVRETDLSSITDIKALFDRLEHLSVLSRPEKPVEPEPEPEREPKAATKGGYAADLDADRQPLSPDDKALTAEQLEKLRKEREDRYDIDKLPAPTKDVDFTPAEFIHTKNGNPIYVAKTARYMSKDEFAAARDRAKQLGGYYSSFKGAGAIPGFHFKTPEARDAFLGGTEPMFLGAARPFKAVTAVYKDDVERVAKEIGLTAKEAYRMLQHLVSPTTGVAMQAHDRVMKMLGERNQRAYETDRVLEVARKAFDKMERKDQVDFVDRMKQGKAQATPELQTLAETMRKIDTESWEAARAAYIALGFKNAEIPLSWLDNHFRVLWKKIPGTDEERSTWIGKAHRGLRGSMGQHKQHTLDTMSEGIEMGGVPYSYNPVEIFKLAQADLWKLTTTLKVWKWAKDAGFVEFVPGPFPKVPDGMVWLDDSIANIYFPAASGEGLVAGGKYAVEEGFGRLLNNYLSIDHIRKTKIGRGLLWIKNFTTSLELSLSPFHAVFETMEMVGSDIGLGLSKLVNRGILKGDLGAAAQGVMDIIKAPASPVTGWHLGREIRKAAGDPEAYFKTAAGKKMLKSYPRAREFIDDLFTAGWKPNELDQDWKNQSVRTFVEAVADIKSGDSHNYIGAGLRAFPAANEMLMKPLFDWYIPSLKVAQFFKEYAEAIEQNERKLKGGILTRAALARQVWEFVEDRFGEMNFDSLFWNRNFKTAMQLMFRSVTWKLGSLHAFAGGFGGQAKEFKAAFEERRAPELHRNMAWLFGMFLLTATLGAIISKVVGRKDPESLTDYVFPQVDPKDNKVRVSLPTYFKDLVHLIHDPKGYVTASMSGWIGRLADLLRNKDYYGVQIRDTDDPVTKQALEVGKYTAQSLLPFSVRGYKQMSAQDVGGLRKAMSFLAMNPAPRHVSQTPAEKKAEEYWKGRSTEAGTSLEQFESKREKRQLVQEIRHGHTPDISAALSRGTIKPNDVKAIYQRAQMGALASQVLHMPLADAEKVYQRASVKERAELAGIMARKRANSAVRGRKMFSGF